MFTLGHVEPEGKRIPSRKMEAWRIVLRRAGDWFFVRPQTDEDVRDL
jgi:hypothetical protein